MYPYYRRPSLFWPIILIGVGVIFLLRNAGVIIGDPWPIVLNLWPVLLIVIGLDILFGRRSAVGGLVSTVLALAVVGFVIWLLVAQPNLPGLTIGGELKQETIEYPLSDIRSAEVNLSFATGDNRVYPLGDSSKLIEGDIRYYGTLRFDANESDNRARVDLSSEARIHLFLGFGAPERWEVGLNQRVTYDLDISLGTGRVDLDLSRLTLDGGRIDVGVGPAELRLPSTGGFTLRINGGVGSLRILAPREVELRAEVDTGIVGGFNPGPRLRSVGDDTYETEGFRSSDNTITLIVDVGVGSITVEDQ